MFSKALFTWVAFPVYVWQGIALRLRIERLLPADVPPEGHFPGKGEEIRLLVAGDSSVAGVGMTALEDTLAFNLAGVLAERTGRPVRWRAAGANSATAGDLRDHVLPHVEGHDFTHVVLAVGTNDMKNFHAVRRFKRDFGTLLYTARTRFPRARIIWAPIADMTRIPALPRALGRILQMRAELINAMGERLCRERGAIVAEPVPIRGPQGFARDGFHAGPDGYRTWAEHLADFVFGQRDPDNVLELKRADRDDHHKAG
ncbi:SGNH/GDSL hydrolase family protein [Oricola thermophila]|uniref:SGNH/GDSL hydrolase family protein n=1 Tax=Oricola thermophila TaxID=2742145 RepID=A0A6N1VHQ1_9HYPH|nr:SGNH/GDSL hydrolase family protein [Oricola thermophila]QKV20431.1 SGNH/GDSL hydrolase family protein [Oricola thermophila]